MLCIEFRAFKAVVVDEAVVSVLLRLELDEAVALVLSRYLVLREVHVDHHAALREELSDYVGGHLLIDVADVDRRFGVSFIEGKKDLAHEAVRTPYLQCY